MSAVNDDEPVSAADTVPTMDKYQRLEWDSKYRHMLVAVEALPGFVDDEVGYRETMREIERNLREVQRVLPVKPRDD